VATKSREPVSIVCVNLDRQLAMFNIAVEMKLVFLLGEIKQL